MKQLVVAWAILFAVGGALLAAQETPITFSVQLIRGTDASSPPQPDAHPAEPELVHRLGMFKWKNYWETRHDTVSLRSGGKSRLHLTAQRDVEIARGPQDVTISIYANGKLTRRRTQSLETAFYIAGGEKDQEECWFVVVRREK